MNENKLIDSNIEQKELESKYIYDKNMMKKPSLRRLLLSQSSKLEILFLFLGIIGAIMNGALSQLLEYYTGKLITYFSSDNSKESMYENLKDIVISYIIVSIFSFFFGFLLMAFCSLYQKRISNKYKKKYFEMLLSMDMEWYDKSGQSIFEINNQVLLELDAIDKGIGNSIGLIFSQVSILVFGYAFSLYICWQFALALMCLLPFNLLIELIIGHFAQKNSKIQEKLSEDIGGHLEERLYKIKTVTAFSNYDYEVNYFNNKLNIFLLNSKKKSFINGLLESSQTFIMGLLMSLSFFVGGYLIYEQITVRDIVVTSGDLYAILEIIMGCNAEIQNIAQHIKLVANALESSKSFFNLLEYYEKRIKEKKIELYSNFNPEEIEGKIEFKNIFFSYPKNESNNILTDFNLVLNSKETTAIIGESGCGKSTITNLLQRIYNYKSGQIILDDKYNIEEIDLNEYRKLFGCVSQEPILFNDSIKNNILLGRNAKNEEIIESAKSSNILNFINNLKNKFGYIVGVKGKKLSGGQKQRIAISRAIILKPKILIFDEATSALDKKNENMFKSIIDSFKGKYTILIISHKLELIKNANKIILLGKEGKILESGTHEELIEKGGKYCQIYKDEISKASKNLEEESLNSENSISTSLEDEAKSIEEIDDKLISDENENSSEEKINENISENKKSIFNKFIEVLNEYKVLLITGVLFSFLSGVSIVILGLILGKSIDKITNPDLDIAKREGIKYSKIILIFTLISTFIDFIRFYSVELLGDTLSTNFKSKIFIMYLGMHMGYFDQKENSPGKLVNEMNMKTSTINDAVLSLLSSLIQCCGDFVSATIIGFIYSWKMTLINTCFIPVIFVINYVHSSYLSSIEKESLNNNFGNIMSETLCNLTTVYSFNCKKHMMNLFENEVNKDLNNLYMKCFISGILQGLVECIIFIDYGTCFYFTGLDVINNQLTLENFLECYASIMTATFYIGTTVNSVKNLSLMRQSIKEIINLLETKSEINPFETKNNLINIDRKKLQGKIEFKNVVFSYPTNSKKIVLSKINISIEPGEKICFIGQSGSGKSTIGQLIERFYDINEGEILIDNIDIKNYNLVSLRKNISYVSQEPVLFNDSIINNIKYGNSSLKYEEIKEYSQMLKIDDKLSENNFSELSGGQKQRIAIIRAILKKAKILILDEATSALDNQTENEVKNLIYNYIENSGITTIVISHKITSFEHFNRVFKIDNGEMFEIKNNV